MDTRSPGGAPRLLYVEDDRVIAGMTVEVLAEAYDVTHVTDGRHALQRALSERFDVMVIDRRLPDLDGLDAGANDYLVKPFDFDELLARLRALVRGHRAEGRRREVGEWAFLPDADVAYGPGGERVSFTPTESRLLSLLSESPEHVFSRQEILRAVFTSDDALSSVDTYVHYIRRKTSPGTIETVRGRGYRAGASS